MVGNLLDELWRAVVTAVMLAQSIWHFRLPSLIQAILDDRLQPQAGGTDATTQSVAAPRATTRQDCRPWLPTEVLPWVQQLNQPTASGAETGTDSSDCGEACCASIIAAARGVPVLPDMLRVMWGGALRDPLTNAADLVAILATANVRSQQRYWPQSVEMVNLRTATQDGRPVIALGYWSIPGNALHWIIVYRVTSTTVHTLNPWDGRPHQIDWPTYHQQSQSSQVEVLDHLLFGEEVPF